MARFRLSAAAERDLEDIGAFTHARWSDVQAARYLRALDQRFHMLAATPYAGPACDEVAPGLRRFPHVSHQIFYEVEPDGGVFIIRVLHESMLPELHLGTDDDLPE